MPDLENPSESAATKTYGWCPIAVQPWRKEGKKKWEFTSEIINGVVGQDYIRGKWWDGEVAVIQACTNQEYDDALQNSEPKKKKLGKLFDEPLDEKQQVTLTTKTDAGHGVHSAGALEEQG